MMLDQSKRCPFFELIDNETDSELAGFTCSRQVDTEQVKSAVKRKIAELGKVLEICEEVEKINRGK